MASRPSGRQCTAEFGFGERDRAKKLGSGGKKPEIVGKIEIGIARGADAAAIPM